MLSPGGGALGISFAGGGGGGSGNCRMDTVAGGGGGAAYGLNIGAGTDNGAA